MMSIPLLLRLFEVEKLWRKQGGKPVKSKTIKEKAFSCLSLGAHLPALRHKEIVNNYENGSPSNNASSAYCLESERERLRTIDIIILFLVDWNARISWPWLRAHKKLWRLQKDLFQPQSANRRVRTLLSSSNSMTFSITFSSVLRP